MHDEPIVLLPAIDSLPFQADLLSRLSLLPLSLRSLLGLVLALHLFLLL